MDPTMLLFRRNVEEVFGTLSWKDPTMLRAQCLLSGARKIRIFERKADVGNLETLILVSGKN